LKILVTGGAGYVGSVLIPTLLQENYQVKCLDRFFFGTEYLESLKSENLELIMDDIRWFNPKILSDVDLVLDLAALSNDPVGDLEPEKTFEINHLGRSRVAQLSKENGVKKYVLASSASIYGQQKTIANEKSIVNPLTAYSKANRKAEEDILKLNDKDFTTTALRFSSIYGISHRMRFDLAVNSMVLDLFQNNKITIFGKNNKRPFVHIKDAIQAYLKIISAPKEKISGEIFNVGSKEQNFTIFDLANKVKNSISPNSELLAQDTPDNRSYFGSFEKIEKTLDFKTHFTVEDASLEIFNSLRDGTLNHDLKTITVKWYKHILENNELKKSLELDGRLL